MIPLKNVEFKDFSIKVKEAISDLSYKSLEEVAGELESQIKRNTPVGKVAGGELKNKWQHRVKETHNGCEATVGNPLERSLWVEFGTGDYAIPDSGKSSRKGGWFIPVGEGEGQISESVAKAYGFTIRNGKDGKKWVFTLGMKPKRPMHNAYTTKKNQLIKRIQSIFRGGLS